MHNGIKGKLALKHQRRCRTTLLELVDGDEIMKGNLSVRRRTANGCRQNTPAEEAGTYRLDGGDLRHLQRRSGPKRPTERANSRAAGAKLGRNAQSTHLTPLKPFLGNGNPHLGKPHPIRRRVHGPAPQVRPSCPNLVDLHAAHDGLV